MLFAFAAFSCHQNDTKSENDKEIDSLGGLKPGMSKDQRIAEIKDSLLKAIRSEQISKDTATTKDYPVKIISAGPFQNEYSNYKGVRLTYKNVSGKRISAIKFKW